MPAERDQRFELRLSPAELDAYRRAADRAGETVSDWIRAACDKQRDVPPETEHERLRRVLSEVEDLLCDLDEPTTGPIWICEGCGRRRSAAVGSPPLDGMCSERCARRHRKQAEANLARAAR